MALAVSYSWFPFLGTRGEYTWGSRVTNHSWKYGAEDEVELESSGVLELDQQTVCSFFPLKKEHLSDLRRSWEDGNCRDGDCCGWVRGTSMSETRLRKCHCLLPFGFGLEDRTA
jgi:hypothetical protein